MDEDTCSGWELTQEGHPVLTAARMCLPSDRRSESKRVLIWGADGPANTQSTRHCESAVLTHTTWSYQHSKKLPAKGKDPVSKEKLKKAGLKLSVQALDFNHQGKEERDEEKGVRYKL